MSVNYKAVGYLTGQAGTGVIYELEENGNKTLAMIWADGKFHELSNQELQDHISQGKAAVTGQLSGGYSSFDLSTIKTTGIERFYKPGQTDQGTDTETEPATPGSAVIKIPYKIEGIFEIDLSQLQSLLSILTND